MRQDHQIWAFKIYDRSNNQSVRLELQLRSSTLWSCWPRSFGAAFDKHFVASIQNNPWTFLGKTNAQGVHNLFELNYNQAQHRCADVSHCHLNLWVSQWRPMDKRYRNTHSTCWPSYGHKSKTNMPQWNLDLWVAAGLDLDLVQTLLVPENELLSGRFIAVTQHPLSVVCVFSPFPIFVHLLNIKTERQWQQQAMTVCPSVSLSGCNFIEKSLLWTEILTQKLRAVHLWGNNIQWVETPKFTHVRVMG